MFSILIVLHRVGPYHAVRFAAACSEFTRLSVLQTRPASTEYPWSFDCKGPFEIFNLTGAQTPEADPPRHDLDLQISALLDQLQPSVVVSVGWADLAYQRLLIHAQRRKTPLVIISDSRDSDEPRTPFKEWLKRRLLRGYSTALVAGQESRSYLEQLKFPASRIYQPWDVVDNAYFESSALLDSPQSAAEPTDGTFLCVSRLISKKNHLGLLAAYHQYQQQGGNWRLKLVGSGPMYSKISLAIQALPDPSRVSLSSFQQIAELRDTYQSASAFILASLTDQWGLVVNEAIASGLPCLVSSACGCAVDLIQHGITGWTFDPNNPSDLAQLMHQADAQSPSQRQEMIQAAREKLAEFSPELFACGLRDAVSRAIASPRFSVGSTFFANLLSLR